jgi:hypothetical protein
MKHRLASEDAAPIVAEIRTELRKVRDRLRTENAAKNRRS